MPTRLTLCCEDAAQRSQCEGSDHARLLASELQEVLYCKEMLRSEALPSHNYVKNHRFKNGLEPAFSGPSFPFILSFCSEVEKENSSLLSRVKCEPLEGHTLFCVRF